MRILNRIVLSFILLLSISFAYGQLSVNYLPYAKQNKNLRTAADSTQIYLPFWDDFTTSYVYPDTMRWLDSENVLIQKGVGINPPSYNVATFDGANQYGNPYSEITIAQGIGDSLVSRFIDMSGADQNSTYLSFYFQKRGLGELPDQGDQLALLIKDVNNQWVQVWDTTGTDIEEVDEFIFKSIKISDENYFHPYFQFKFISYGRLSGPFDTWHVDYIYLDEKRSGGILDLSDHTIVSHPTSIFKDYFSVPYDHFISNPGMYLDSTSIDLLSIEASETNIETSFILERQSGEEVAAIDLEKELNSNIGFLELRKVFSSPLSQSLFDGAGDSLYLKTVSYINTLDTIKVVNLRINDTVSTHFSIHQDLAYDDGSAEFSAGMKRQGDRLAYQYYTPIEDQITAVKIYFPSFAIDETSRSFVLKIWSELGQDTDGQLLTQDMLVQQGLGINEFGIYDLARPITVSDTFYIGFEQSVEGDFPIGLDKNNDTGDRMFFNLGFAWEQNTEVEGSLMMRPVFGNAEDVVTSVENELSLIKVFPNPSQGIFNIEGDYDSFVVLDLHGRVVTMGNEKRTQVDLNGHKNGVYFLKLRHSGNEEIFKLIIK